SSSSDGFGRLSLTRNLATSCSSVELGSKTHELRLELRAPGTLRTRISSWNRDDNLAHPHRCFGRYYTWCVPRAVDTRCIDSTCDLSNHRHCEGCAAPRSSTVSLLPFG